jgi:hypothetical protein
VNPLAFAALLAPAVLGAPVRGTLDVGDRTEARGGYLGLPTDPALNLETAPSATVNLDARRTTFMLQYAPHLGLTNVEIELRPYLLHAGAAEVVWRARWLRLSLNEVASYGDLNTTSALPSSSFVSPGTSTAGPAATGGAPMAPPVTTPGATGATGVTGGATPGSSDSNGFSRLRYQASTTTLAAMLTPSRRWSLRLALSYTLNGGADNVARQVLAYQYGPRAEATFEHTLSVRDHLVTQASAEGSTLLSIIPHTDGEGVALVPLEATYGYVFVRGSEGWSHHFTRATEASISGGVTEVHSDLQVLDPVGPPSPPQRFWKTYPTAEVSLIQQLPVNDRFDVQVRALLTPAVNRLTGLLSQQVQGLLNANWKRARFTHVAEGALAQSVRNEEFAPPGTDPLTTPPLSTALSYASLRVGTAFAFTRYCSLEGGLIFTYQKAGDFPALSQKMGYVALALRAPTVEF